MLTSNLPFVLLSDFGVFEGFGEFSDSGLNFLPIPRLSTIAPIFGLEGFRV